MNIEFLKEEYEKAKKELRLLTKCAKVALASGIITLEETKTLNDMLSICEGSISWRKREYEQAIKAENNDN